MYPLYYFRKLQLGKTVLIIDKKGKRHFVILSDEDVRDYDWMAFLDIDYGKIIDMDATKKANKELRETGISLNKTMKLIQRN